MTKIIAHRGARREAPENTLAAFQKAFALGAQMVEFDVRKTKDDVLIIHHDAKIGAKKIKNLILAEVRKAKKTVPTLEEALEFLRDKGEADIELKEKGIETAVAQMAQKYLGKDKFIISSFQRGSVKILKEKFPEIKVGLLIGENNYKNSWWKYLRDAFPFYFVHKNKIDFLIAHQIFLPTQIIRRARKEKIPIIIWGVNSKKIFSKLLAKDVFGVITDFPDFGS